MRIAICDDDKKVIKQAYDIIKSYNKLPIDTSIFLYDNGKTLIKTHIINKFDIIFLDIKMEEVSGLEIGNNIRKYDKDVIIIFLTNYDQYVFQSFKVEAFDYLLKPINNNMLNNVLARAVNKYYSHHQIIKFQCKDTTFILDVGEIVYLEGYYHRIGIITNNNSNKYECFGKLSEYEKMLKPYNFLRCHQGILINMKYIKKIENSIIITSMETTVPLSVRKKKNCLMSLNEYVTKYRV